MDKYKIHKAVEYIRTQPEFPFDGVDVEESLEEVLAYFGLHPQLDEDEEQVLRQELLPMVWEDEEAEVSLLVEQSAPSLLAQASDSPRAERCTREGVHLFLCQPMIVACPEGLRQGVSPLSGENAP